MSKSHFQQGFHSKSLKPLFFFFFLLFSLTSFNLQANGMNCSISSGASDSGYSSSGSEDQCDARKAYRDKQLVQEARDWDRRVDTRIKESQIRTAELQKFNQERRALDGQIDDFFTEAKPLRGKIRDLPDEDQRDQYNRALNAASAWGKTARWHKGEGDLEGSRAALQAAQTIVNTITSVNPVTGFVRDLCGAVTGIDPVTGELTDGERGFALASAVTLGLGNSLFKSAKMAMNLIATATTKIKKAKPFGDLSLRFARRLLGLGESGLSRKEVKVLLHSAAAPAREGAVVSRAGRALQKHAARNNIWPKAKGSPKKVSETGLAQVHEILEAPGKFVFEDGHWQKWAGGKGLRIGRHDRRFITFLDLNKGA